MTLPQRPAPWLACLGLASLLAGCQPASTPPAVGPQAGSTTQPPGGPAATTPAGATFDADSEPFSAGKKVFVANNCFRCHAINGVRGSGGPGGPPPGPGGSFGSGGPPSGPGGPGGPPPGPNGPGGPPPGPGPGGPPSGPGGPGGPGGPRGPGGRGPDLGKVGAEESHTAAWLVEYVRDPKSKKADARMPAFDGKIKDDDLKALGDFLASLK